MTQHGTDARLHLNAIFGGPLMSPCSNCGSTNWIVRVRTSAQAMAARRIPGAQGGQSA